MSTLFSGYTFLIWVVINSNYLRVTSYYFSAVLFCCFGRFCLNIVNSGLLLDYFRKYVPERYHLTIKFSNSKKNKNKIVDFVC